MNRGDRAVCQAETMYFCDTSKNGVAVRSESRGFRRGERPLKNPDATLLCDDAVIVIERVLNRQQKASLRSGSARHPVKRAQNKFRGKTLKPAGAG